MQVEFYVALRGVALLQMDPEAITVDKLETTELPPLIVSFVEGTLEELDTLGLTPGSYDVAVR